MLFHQLLGLLPMALALLADPESLKNEILRADLVADVEIETTRALLDSGQGIESESMARVIAFPPLAPNTGGFQIGDPVTIRWPGGETEKFGAFLSGYPRLRKGHRYRVALQKRVEVPYFEILGLEFGAIPLTPVRTSSRNRTDGSDGSGTGPYLYWDRSYTPIPYFISSPELRSFPDFIPAIDASFTTWRSLEDVRIEFLSSGCSSTTRNENDGINHVILVTRNWPFNPNAIAVTRNYYVGGESVKTGMILDSDILLNGVNHSFTTTNEAGKHDLQNILTHEIGHFLGLGHEINPKDIDATMYEAALPNETKKRDLNTSDLEGLRSAYLGNIDKFPFSGTDCKLSSANTGCAAVHSTPTGLTWGSCLVLFFFFAGIWGARFISTSFLS